MTAYLEKYGLAVFENGYDPCFIVPGEKRPYGKEWESKTHGPKTIAKALTNGQAKYGVGIKTKFTPLVDIDCYDKEIVDKIKKYTFDLLGETLERVGLPPKTGLVYRSEDPFPKTQSRVYIDDQGRPVKLEVLGHGQQFVALHIHPDTGEPYRWKDKRHPGNTPQDTLPEITHSDAQVIVDEFERLAKKRGWQLKRGGAQALQRVDIDLDDPFITDKRKVDLPAEEIRAKLQMVPNPQDYDQWFFIGMALYHQFDGDDEGLELWHEWSAQAPNYDRDALDDKWDTFDIEGKRREPLTARYILKQAKAEEERLAGEELDEVKKELRNCDGLAAVKKLCKRIKKIPFDQLIREDLVGAIRAKAKEVGTNISLTTIRGMVRYENPENRSMPTWLEDFVYCQIDETFYSTKTHQSLARRSFDDTYGRYMMTKKDRLEGRSHPEHTASQVALHRYQIPTVANRMYLPNGKGIFSINGLDYVNSYNICGIPELPSTLNERQREAIDRVLRHFEHLIINERDRKLLLSYFAYIVQTGKRINWVPVIQGVEGDGKSFFFFMMQAAIGAANATTIGGNALSETNTAWAEGAQFCLIEEIRLNGKDRYDVINKIKPYITNSIVQIRRMRTDWYLIINTMNYLMTTNYKDGIPIHESDTRYFPIFSRWQSGDALREFNESNPDYFNDLYDAIDEPGAIRKMFMEYALHPEFNAVKRAPVSASREEMRLLTQSDEDEALELALASSTNPSFSRIFLDTSLLEQFMEQYDVHPPQGGALKRLLSKFGFTYIGRHKIGGKNQRFYSMEPQRFVEEGSSSYSSKKIREYLAAAADWVDI